MSYFSRLGSAIMGSSGGSVQRDPLDDFWYDQHLGRKTFAGVTVTVRNARTLPVVRDCLQVLAQSAAGLSFAVFRRADINDRQRVHNHPVARQLRKPNVRTTQVEFMTALIDDLASSGYSLVEHVGKELYRIDPAYVIIEELPDRSLRFRVNEPGRVQRILTESEVWYIPVPPAVGCRGRSAIMDDGREAIGALMGLQEYNNSFWANDAQPPLIFKHAGHFKAGDDKENFLRAWARLVTGRNRGRPGILEYGIEVEKLAGSQDANQFIQTRKELALDIARLWRMQPHKVGILDKATFSNIEHQSLEFVVDTLMPWIRLVENSITTWLIGVDTGFYFQFNVASLLRGDTKARFESYAKSRQWGWMSVNEIRAKENMNSIGAAGDRYIEPLNMRPVGSEGDDDVERKERAMRTLHATVGRPRIVQSTSAVLESYVQRGDETKLRLVGE